MERLTKRIATKDRIAELTIKYKDLIKQAVEIDKEIEACIQILKDTE